MQRSTPRFAPALGVAILALSFSGLVNAGSADGDAGVRKTEVSYADLNLERASDANALYSRIERAATSVCRAQHGPSAKHVALERACTVRAIDGAVRSVAHPNLLTAYAQRRDRHSMLASSR